MPLDKSLKVKKGANRNRSVLTRLERINRLKDMNAFGGEEESPFGLPKVRVKQVQMKKKKKTKEEVEEKKKKK